MNDIITKHEKREILKSFKSRDFKARIDAKFPNQSDSLKKFRKVVDPLFISLIRENRENVKKLVAKIDRICGK